MTDARVEKNLKSILNLNKLLHDVIASPGKYAEDVPLKNALISQGALSKYVSEADHIFPTSINTLKRITNEHLDLRFEGFDNLRKKCLVAIDGTTSVPTPPKSRKQSLEERLETAEANLLTARQDLWLITIAFEKSLRQGRSYAESSKDVMIQTQCRRDQDELRDMFNLRSNLTD